MGDDDDRHAQRIAQAQYQLIEFGRDDRVETRRRSSVAAQVHHDGARQSRALDHAAGQLVGIRSWKPPRLTTSSEPAHDANRVLIEPGCSRSSATLSPTLIDVSSAPPWNDTPIWRRTASISRSPAVPMSTPSRRTFRCAAVQPQQVPQQRTLAGPRSTHDHPNLARVHAEIDAVENAPAPVPGFQLSTSISGWRISSFIDQSGPKLLIAQRLRKNEKIMSATMM
jgi:hypothetical protein